MMHNSPRSNEASSNENGTTPSSPPAAAQTPPVTGNNASIIQVAFGDLSARLPASPKDQDTVSTPSNIIPLGVSTVPLPQSLDNARIAIIDDDKGLLTVTEMILSGLFPKAQIIALHFGSKEIPDMESLVKTVNTPEKPIHAMLTDVDLSQDPENGPNSRQMFNALLTQSNPGAVIPPMVIVLTGRESNKERFQNAPFAHEFMLKPIDYAKLGPQLLAMHQRILAAQHEEGIQKAA